MEIKIGHIFGQTREVPQSSMEFTPFKLVCRANPGDLLRMYRELLAGKTLTQQNQANYEIVTQIRDRVMKLCEML